jgi:hypothetical protein
MVGMLAATYKTRNDATGGSYPSGEYQNRKRSITMKTESKKSSAGKIATLSIVALVAAGAVAISGIADIAPGSGILAKTFILFIGAVIVLQIVPGIMLMVAMFKGVYSLFSKKATEPAEVPK